LAKRWFKENLVELALFLVLSVILTPAYFYNDNNFEARAIEFRSFDKCNKISTQYIKQRCYEKVWERYRDYCPEIALSGNVKGCIRDMRARMKALRPKPKFPLKLSLFLLLEFLLGVYFFYFKKRWRSYT